MVLQTVCCLSERSIYYVSPNVSTLFYLFWKETFEKAVRNRSFSEVPGLGGKGGAELARQNQT
jgi:hypothetical protein